MTIESQPSIFDDGILTIDAVFSPAECQALIELAEKIGFEAATVRPLDGPKMMTNKIEYAID
jgi:hypothetical protein